jgi:hypothetical protein
LKGRPAAALRPRAAEPVTQITARFRWESDIPRAMSAYEGSRLNPDKILLAVAILLGLLTTALSF